MNRKMSRTGTVVPRAKKSQANLFEEGHKADMVYLLSTNDMM